MIECLNGVEKKYYSDGYVFKFNKEVWEPSIALPAPVAMCMDFIRMSGDR